jgi:hypothetical protein
MKIPGVKEVVSQIYRCSQYWDMIFSKKVSKIQKKNSKKKKKSEFVFEIENWKLNFFFFEKKWNFRNFYTYYMYLYNMGFFPNTITTTQ